MTFINRWLLRRGLLTKPNSLDRHGVIFNVDLGSQKQIRQPCAGLDMIGDLRNDESAFSFGQSCKRNNLIGCKAINCGARVEIGQQMFGHIMPNCL